jgi:hypothetical protein
MDRRRILVWLLRMTGVIMLTALVFVFAPFEWMVIVHRQIGMGELIYTPLLSYLTRTLSGVYAVLGAVLLFISFDLARYRSLIRFLGVVAILGGAGVTFLSALLGLPLFWTLSEGPLTVALGVAMMVLSRRI